MNKILISASAVIALTFTPNMVHAQTASTEAAETNATASAQLRIRTEDIAAYFRGDGEAEDLFAPSFLAAVPAERMRALADQMVAQYGPVKSVHRIAPDGANKASVELAFEKALVGMSLTLATEDPHKVIGLLLTGTKTVGDTLASIDSEFAALPGNAGYHVEMVGEDESQSFGTNEDRPFAIGSTFKLYILAELDRQIRTGKRSWADVVELGPKSHPSGISQDWPDASPITLHTLATLMISRSDNTATDTLVRVLGQDALASMVRDSGHSAPSALIPMLMTQQSSALKMKGNSDLRTAYLGSTDAGQRALLEESSDRLGLDDIEIAELVADPLYIEQIEWFATPSDITRLWEYMASNASEDTRDILTISKGVGPGDAARWDYLGYKGGSESGVISMNFMGKSKAGEWVFVSGSWNNPKAPVEDAKFSALMSRLLNLLAE